ncbi:MAG: ferrous iron transport protein B [Deltaproteobacteria bacterium]|nr:ferrous iron transport protein B [Deltaproteobacteria bacterium]
MERVQKKTKRARETFRVALAGNPNSGKTSLFNVLTGTHQHVGNYPGVTVERREGHYTYGDSKFEILDLPGTYSLTSFSPEERIAQEVLIEDDLDVVVVIVDSTVLGRSLTLLAQIMLAGANPVLCLNMSDEADKAGLEIDVGKLRTLLGFPVVRTTGHKGLGSTELKEAIARAAHHAVQENRLVLGERLKRALADIVKRLPETMAHDRGRDWIASRLLLGDASFTDKLAKGGEKHAAIDEAGRWRKKIERETGQDITLFMTQHYFGFVDGLLREAVTQYKHIDSRAVSDHIDMILVNRYLGIPFFLVIMYLIFWITFSLGNYPMDWITTGLNILGNLVSSLWPPGSDSALRSLLVDGIIGGVGGVLVFLPNIILLFMGLAFLEDSGYMARAAFLMDRLMHRFGLHGKSFVPMMTGFGCSIPGIMATRTLENERDRLTTMLVLPLMSCGARLPIWMLLIPAFFAPAWHAPILFLIYFTGIVLALLIALLLRRSLLAGEDAPFVMELPPYRLPTLRAVGIKMFERSWMYLRKAGTIILGFSIIMWAITSYPKLDRFQVDSDIAAGKIVVMTKDTEDISKAQGDVQILTPEQVRDRRAAENLEYSVAGRIGRFIEPVMHPLGFDWRIDTAMLGAFAAKELFVSQIGIVFSLGAADDTSVDLRAVLRKSYSPLTGFTLMLFMLIAMPCMATIAVTSRESGSWKWAALQLFGLTAIAWILSAIVFQVGNLFI